MEGQYSEKVMEHFKNPRNVGEIPDASGIGNVGNPVCGDIMRLYIKVDDKEVITDAKFKTFGCGAAIATSSMVTELVKGKTVDEALKVSNHAVAEALGFKEAQVTHHQCYMGGGFGRRSIGEYPAEAALIARAASSGRGL